MKHLLAFGKELKNKVKEDRATGLAAEQAYYYLLSLFPLLILLLSILPYLNIEPQQAINFMNHFLPSETTGVLADTIIEVVTKSNGGLFTIGIIGTIWSASKGMNAFMHAMNVAFDVKETRNFIMARLISIALTLGLIVAFIIVLVLPIFGNVILNITNQVVPVTIEFKNIFNLLRWGIAFVVIVIVLTLLYKFAPNKKYLFKHVLPGAIVATITWLIISIAFSFYISNFGNYSSTYGSLGGIIVLMLWLYATGLILVIGGEINAIFHNRFSSSKEVTRVKPVNSRDRKLTT
ncbi:YihY/virulence factor BrkB family protein [Peribacillus huizhouensis]|uniref:Membrane protein n=1 Tax=Peribacillus huizhouensis TaxID=1501239 RepID=A0ABR6CNB3_9BACI|nr:YihY/virulence factor BrkB family protein [Peribacillus huizhouensis]MBA9026522.1 membrane protein [Peribacillus huizhouensis]